MKMPKIHTENATRPNFRKEKKEGEYKVFCAYSLFEFKPAPLNGPQNRSSTVDEE